MKKIEVCCWRERLWNIVQPLVWIIDALLIVITLGFYDLELRGYIPFFCDCACSDEMVQEIVDKVVEKLAEGRAPTEIGYGDIEFDMVNLTDRMN